MQFNHDKRNTATNQTMEKTMTGRIQLKQLSETHALLVADHQALKLQTNEQCDVIRRQVDELEKKDAEIAALKKRYEELDARNDRILDLLTEKQVGELIEMDKESEESEESEDEESEDEDDGEMEVYFETETFGNLCGEHEHLKEFHDFHYYQCWGGGGDGGYIVNEKNFVFRVSRNWGTPFSVEKVAGIIRETERDGLKFIRII